MEAAKLFTEAMLLERSPNPAYKPTPKTMDNFRTSSKVALRFHEQQLQELIYRGHLDQSYLEEVAACQEIIENVPYNITIKLRDEDLARLPSYVGHTCTPYR